MRIVLVSDHTLTSLPQYPSQFAKSLVQNGVQVYWLAATGMIADLASDPDFRPAEAGDMPATCRYVIPYTIQRLDGVRLIGIEPAFWHDRALHTRLFTFLRLLHREQPFTVLQSWGELSTAYLTVYAAAFLNLPGTVFYTPSCLQEDPQQAFLRQWVARHAAMAFTAHADGREQLLNTSSLQPGQVKVIDPTQPSIGLDMAAWYQVLAQNFSVAERSPFCPKSSKYATF